MVLFYVGALMLDPRESFCGAVARLPLACMGGSHERGFVRLFVWAEPDGSARADWRTSEAEAQIEALPEAIRSRAGYAVWFRPRLEGVNLWSPIVERRRYSIRIDSERVSLTPAEVVSYRGAAFDFLQREGVFGPLPAALRTADLTTSEFRWRGLAGNLFAATCVGVLVAWIAADLRRQAGVHRTGRLTRHGKCGTCGYDLVGLERKACPECGSMRGA